MIPVHTQKSLDQLTWNEVQKIHASLGLKATAATRTRRDYQKRIVAAMPQPIVEPEQVATPLTCATCPLARHIDGDRYCCGLTDAVVRGHWEAKTDCYDAVADQVETETTEPAAEVAPQETATKTESPIAQPEQTPAAEITDTTTDDAPPNRGDNGRGRVTALTLLPEATIALPHATKPKADDNFMTAFTKESESDRKFNDLAYLSQLEMEAQLAIERTVIGSEDEAIAYRHLRSIEEDIKYYGQSNPEPQPSPVIIQLEKQMTQLKNDVLSLFKITAFDPSILPIDADELEQPATQSDPEPEGTIHWHSPSNGLIVGKKESRHFYIRNFGFGEGMEEIMVVINANFTAPEFKKPNLRHTQIRAALNAGRTFDPRAFKNFSQFLTDTKDYRGIGRIMQGQDGRWWAWVDGGVTGQPFPYENLATQYLERVAASKQAQISCIK